MTLPRLLSAAALLLAPALGFAAVPKGMDLPACAAKYAPEFGVDLKLIQAIRIAEGGAVGKSVCGNKNETCDHGPMQINDGWFDGRWGVNLPADFGVSKDAVLNDECQNIRVGMWVLHQAHGKLNNWYEAVAAYNAGIKNRKVGYAYANRVFRWYDRITPDALKSKRAGKHAVTASNGGSVQPELRQLVRVSGT